ncbi:MAG: hypothetical protein KY475_17005 [Planctomycetes bacterium]|nr:hypothetical protein [Planctomycetota bacterium]
MFDSFRRRIADARRDNQLFFASLISEETIASTFGSATAKLDSARIYTTAVTVWTFLSQVLSADHGCVVAGHQADRLSVGQRSFGAVLRNGSLLHRS